MTYSYTQISQKSCVALVAIATAIWMDGRKKITRAAMVFGRCFEAALGVYFC